MKNVLSMRIISMLSPNFYELQKSVAETMHDKKHSGSSMEVEINQQPEILANLAEKYITPEKYILINIPLNIKKVMLVASGSSYHCAYIGAEILKELADCDAECIYSSEFTPKTAKNADKDTLFVFVSQSGETSDTLAAMKEVAKYSDRILCITNNEDSTMWSLAHYRLNTMAGKENSIASTKAMSAQLYCLYLLVLKIMYSKNINVDSELAYIQNIPAFIRQILEDSSNIKAIAKRLSKFNNISILGSRSCYALAKEGALKIKETSYINTMAYPIGEFMHGHVAILNQKSAIISIVDKDCEDISLKNLERIKQDYNPYIVTISNKDCGKNIEKVTSNDIRLSVDTQIFTLFGGLIVLQLLALEIAKSLKRNIDRPIGLKKIVIN